MNLRLRITARAARDIEGADAWWRTNRLSVPDAVRKDLEAAFELLINEPGIGARVALARLPGTRRLHLKRIRYFLYYRVRGEDLVVLRVWHSSRGTTPQV